LNTVGVGRELALTVAQSSYHFQKMLYKVACLEESDFKDSRLFIYVDGKIGPAGNLMNSPWDQFLSNNPLLTVMNYRLHNDEWETLTTQGVSYWKRLKVAGYETIIFRLAIKLMKKLPNWMFTKELLMPNENELNIEIASSLALHGVRVTEVQLDPLYNSKNIESDIDTILLYKVILPIMRKRIERWVVPSAVEVTMMLFKSHLEKQLKQFKLLSSGWERVIIKSDRIKQSVLINAPGNTNGHALAYICKKNNIPFISSQHGVTVEISKAHSMLHPFLDNSISDAVFSYNSKIVNIEKNTHFDKSKHHIIGAPFRLIRMKNIKPFDKSKPQIVYISTNLYHMGFSIAQKTDYALARDEQRLVKEVLNKLPHKVRYKTYPEDNRRYADEDPVFSDIRSSENIEIFSDKIDMRYLISEHRVLVTTCATSTLSWPVMSDKPVVFINQKHNNPLTNDAYISLSKGIFVFDDGKNFYNDLRSFLSQPIDEIERLWQEKKSARDVMIKRYFSKYEGGAGKRATKIILKEYLS
jgi:hypothetical protein